MTPDPKPTEETWWEVTTGRGLMLTLPAPLTTTGSALDPLEAMRMAKRPDATRQSVFASHSPSTGRMYVFDLSDAVIVKAYTMALDLDRLKKSILRASQTSSERLSSDGQDAASPSDETGSRGGRSIGGRIRRNILH